ncbi:TIGR00341 family protein [Microbacterium sp. SSW1-59]|uniref:TIGR00341 family protein n=1 Tax=Microbacterium xanthum TaxID=3079794 RepID=UPI002AD2E687|nr:TIGR00341 family protein [Microbacterium sp. SSW1-59]MDZ8199904.1 TIGR00341 family protein [Microbacterium sp. SSW1-59]
MSRLSQLLIPDSQRQSMADLLQAVDLRRGDALAKRSGFLIMLVLSAVIAVAGVLSDSTATVIGAMIIAPLGTPILGVAAGIVTGHRGLVARSFLWVLMGLLIVVVIGWVLSTFIADPAELNNNSQITGRTSPQLMDLVAALATGTAGAFAMTRRDLSAVLPGVAIAISLVPPLGVVGVCAGQGAWEEALGALLLFASNVVSLVIAGSIVFTLAGYAREPGASRTANRRRAYAVVAVLSVIIVVPLLLNTAVTLVVTHWTTLIRASTVAWLSGDEDAQVQSITWTVTTATVDVTTEDGDIPPLEPLRQDLEAELPSFIEVDVVVSPAVEHVVLPR